MNTKLRHRSKLDPKIESSATIIVDAAFKVHSTLGPGLLESVYEACLAHELKRRGLNVRQQVPIPIVYEGLNIEVGLRLDLLVDENIIVELKAVETLLPVHQAQKITYLKLSRSPLGLLINFNEEVIRTGITRIVNGLEDEAPR